MTDQENKPTIEAAPTPLDKTFETTKKQPGALTLTIVYDEATDAVALEGPLDARGKCYMMLAMAEKLVDDHHAKRLAETAGAKS